MNLRTEFRYVLRRLDNGKFIRLEKRNLVEVDDFSQATHFDHQCCAETVASRYFYYDGKRNRIPEKKWRELFDAQTPDKMPFAGVAINKFDYETYEIIKFGV